MNQSLSQEVIIARPQHLEGMVECHIAAFPHSFLTLMGRGFLRCFYRFYMKYPQGIAMVAVDDAGGRVMGLVAGGKPEARAIFIRRHILRVAATVCCKAVGNAFVRRRFMVHLGNAVRSMARKLQILSANEKNPSAPEDPPGTWSNLLSICVHPAFRGRGVGQQLMEAFRIESARRGYKTMRLSAHNDNEPALALYKKCGWKLILTTPKGTYFKRSVEESP